MYSKYCKECSKLLAMIDPDSFLLVCVDNVNIRQKILKDTRFIIRNVPSILEFNEEDKSFQKYEAHLVNDWLIRHRYLPSPSSMIVSPTINENQFVAENDSKPIVSLETIVEDSNEQDDDDVQDQEFIPPPQSDSTIPDTDSMATPPSDRPDATTVVNRKQNSVLNIAQQMQREREKEEKPAGKPVPTRGSGPIAPME
jgi:hypothetical protein